MNAHEQEERDFGRGPALWDADPDVCCAAFQLGACEHTEGGEDSADAPLTDDELAEIEEYYGTEGPTWYDPEVVRVVADLRASRAEVERLLSALDCTCIPYHLIGCPQYAESWRRRATQRPPQVWPL